MLQSRGEQGGEQRLLVSGEAEREHLVVLMSPNEDRRFGHLVHQRAMAADGLGAAGDEPPGRSRQHGIDEGPAVGKMQVDRATGHAGLAATSVRESRARPSRAKQSSAASKMRASVPSGATAVPDAPAVPVPARLDI